MAKGRNVKEMNEVDLSQKIFMPSQRYPASCPWCGTNSRINIPTSGNQAGNRLDCENCSTTYTWQ